MKINQLKIKGFKKFKELTVNFNNIISILVGENEVGKSTILKAIDIVLNQNNFLYNDNSVHKFINLSLSEDFFNHSIIKNLPKIEIELFLDLDNHPKSLDFCGLHYNNHNNKPQTGIKFVYEFDEEFSDEVDLNELAEHKIIPTEYYKATWRTFQGKSYKKRMSPIKMIYLDNTIIKHDIFGNYARQIYSANIENKNHRIISSNFKKSISKFRNDYDNLLTIQDNKKLGIDASKSDILKLLDIYEDEVSIQDMGKGKENIIRTEMALNNNAFDLVLIDEPESHLSYTRTRKLINVIKNISQGQVVIASHSSLIVNRLNLKNTIILSKDESYSLDNLTSETAKYFEKIDNLDILRFILAEKVILVEGAAEYIILPQIFNYICGTDMDSYGIDVISMGSISYERYRELSKILNKKTVVITDNDKKDIGFKNADNFKIFCDSSSNNWTLEVSFYNRNQSFFDNLYNTKKTNPTYNGEEMEKAKAHMLKNKTENALEIEKALQKSELCIPDYLIEAVKWIKE
ncbi:ATP-dependent nuclease [Staphylococcus pasteuri]|uniref:ATP-dependent nuclease n=1 Tax=Staphylococcus pasteuri TaxID=45972 RepID=UPI003261ADE4